MDQGRLTIKSLPEIKMLIVFKTFLKVFRLSQARTVCGISFQTRGANTLNELSPAVGRVARGYIYLYINIYYILAGFNYP